MFNDGGGRISAEAVQELVKIVDRVASQADDPQNVYEIFKTRFGNSNRSSSASWAQSDMLNAMLNTDRSIPEAIESYWTAMEAVGEQLQTPSAEQVNNVLRKYGVGYVIKPPRLVQELGSGIVAASSATTGGLITGYVLGEKIGGGGFGLVHRATRATQVGEFEFAVKLHRPSVFVDPDRALKRFAREVSALKKLQHRAIVSYVDAGLDAEGRPFLVMPLIDGPNLRDATSPVNYCESVGYVVEVLRAIEYAHLNNVLHRDLKPANILVRRSDSQPIVVDFGLAYLFEEATQESLTSAGIGTGAYIPFEVWINPKERSQLHDIYSCGVVLYELIARRVPDPANYSPLAHLEERLSGLDGVIRKALAPAANRYQSAADFRRELESVLATLG